MGRRAWFRGLIAFGTWWLVQVPGEDVRLADPGGNLPPIAQFKRVKQFDSAGACEAYRDVALQDGALMGSDAMLDQASSLRCVAAEQLAPATVGPPATP